MSDKDKRSPAIDEHPAYCKDCIKRDDCTIECCSGKKLDDDLFPYDYIVPGLKDKIICDI